MFYKLLGMTAWKVGKVLLRRRYGATYAPKPVVAGGAVLAAVSALLLARNNDS